MHGELVADDTLASATFGCRWLFFLCMYDSFVCFVVFVVVNFCAASFTCRFALSLAVTVVIVVIVVVVDLAFITAFADVQMYILMQDAPLIVHGFFW